MFSDQYCSSYRKAVNIKILKQSLYVLLYLHFCLICLIVLLTFYNKKIFAILELLSLQLVQQFSKLTFNSEQIRRIFKRIIQSQIDCENSKNLSLTFSSKYLKTFPSSVSFCEHVRVSLPRTLTTVTSFSMSDISIDKISAST